jgi:Leucine-rich repeat (LRR) protein
MAHHRPIDKEFEEADDTGVLVLSSRNLRNFPVVPGELCDFNDLLEADFSSNRFDHVPHEVCDFKELVRLTFYRNLLRSVPEDLNRLENLKDLNLSRNLLETIPVGLSHMNLHSLDLSNNRLVSLPIELGCMKQLRYLNLSCNRLPDLPGSIVDLSALQHLDLHRNQLKELPDDIHMLALRYLDISCNRVTALPNTLRHIENTLKIFKMADNPVESPPTHVCVRGLMHIVKWMEGMEKHGSDPHLLSVSSLSSREASLARRSKAKRQSNSRSFIDSSPGENGILNLDEVTNLVNSSLGRGPPPLTKEDGEITPTHTSSPMHWSVAQFRNSPGSVMSDQSKEEYREAAHKLYMQQERQKNRNLRRKRSSSPIQATAKAAVAMTKQQSGSTDFNSLPRRSSKEEMMVTQSSPSSGGTKSLGGSPRVAPARSLPGERHPRPGSWNSHVKVTSSPILPSKYALPANEKPASEDGGSSKGGESEEELRKKQSPPTAPKPDPVVHRNVSSEARSRAQAEETHKKPPPLESAVAAVPPSSVSNRDSHQNHRKVQLYCPQPGACESEV